MKQRSESANWMTRQKKHPERTITGKKTKKEQKGVKGTVGQQET